MKEEEYNNLIDMVNMMNEDEEVSKESKDIRKEVRVAIESQVDIANNVIDSIKETFIENCGHNTKYSVMLDQIKNWEKTLRGVCEQIMNIVEMRGLILKKGGRYEGYDGRDIKYICAPNAYKVIIDNSSRDYDVIKLASAIIYFYNSLV